MSNEVANDYFRFIANLGMTKHPGSLAATRRLIDWCHLEAGQRVLDVGCGVGATPVYLAKKVGCRVVGVDLLPQMIAQAARRVKAPRPGAGRVADRISLAVADARALPFADDSFDAVITESVNVFFDDKGQALREYTRVTRPGGYVGLSELTWLEPPTSEVADYMKRVAYVEAEEAAGWEGLLSEAGLVEVRGEAAPVDLRAESRGRIQRYGCLEIFKPLINMIAMYIKDPRSRRFVKEAAGGFDKQMMQMVGNGIYVGRKPAA